MAALVAALAVLAAAAPPVHGAPPRLEVVPWSSHVVPPVFDTADSARAARITVDTLGAAARPHLAAAYRATPPTLDGNLDDWPLVRWNDLAGAPALLRGTWGGPGDYALRFALAWNDSGVYLAARLLDDHLAPGIVPLRRQESVTLAFGTASVLVGRYWYGGSRRFRLRGDGDVEAWTDVRNRHIERFDPAALGVRGAVRRDPAAGRLEAELFVPWAALYPAVPHPAAGLVANLFVDDVDGAEEKQLAWATSAAARGTSAHWARLDCRGGPAPGWCVVTGTRYPESVAEWVLVPRGEHRAATASVRWLGGAFAGWRRQQVTLAGRAPFLLRLHGVPGSQAVWPAARRYALELRVPGEPARRFDLALPVDAAALVPVLDSLRADTLGTAGGAWPGLPDVEVRLAAARSLSAGIGSWQERRSHATGVLALRAATFCEADRQLDEAALLGGVVGRAAPIVRAQLALRWAELDERGMPLGIPLLRGYRSVLDGTSQPYMMQIPATAAPPAPLLVVLHDSAEDERAPLVNTSLRAQAAARGWVLVCPRGRGDGGYQGPGERDVIDVIDAVRAAVPVDGRRLYLTGSGMGGTGTWLLALRHPDLFAAASIVSGYGDLDQSGIFEALHYTEAERAWFDAHNPQRLVQPDLVTAFRIAHAERDPVVSSGHGRILQSRLAEVGLPCEFKLDPGADHGPRFFDDDLAANCDFLSRHARPRAGEADRARFGGSGPPVADVWARGPVAIVWGTGAAATLTAVPRADDVAVRSDPRNDHQAALEIAAEWRTRYGGDLPLLPDTLVTPAMQAEMNLLLVGDAGSNRLLERYASGLPVRYDVDAFIVDGHAYPTGKFGLVFAAVNPEFPARTLVVFTAMAGRLGTFPRPPLDLGAGYALVGTGVGLIDTGNFPTSR